MRNEIKLIRITLREAFYALLCCGIISIFPNETASGQTADRVVVAINSIPYTQLQIERFINVKETLRDNVKTAQIVKESNWPLALEVFIRDMMIHQDATKSSGFRPTKEAILRLRTKSSGGVADAPQFKDAFERLGLTQSQAETEVLKIGTIENYRRGKKSLDINGKSSSANWEDELVKRSIVRYFDEAKTWKPMTPKP
jgi:hypothetical protein